MDAIHVNGVFEGGGIRGVALAGAAAAALDLGFRFDHVVGTSAGSLVASLLAAGYTADELAGAVCQTDWGSLLDPVPSARIPIIGSHLAYVLHRGRHRGDALERAWSRLLAIKGVAGFRDLSRSSLEIVATDITHSRGVALPSGLAMYGVDPDRFPVAKAVRMSAAVPFLFQPVPLHDRETGERVLFSDGAMAANFPIGLVRTDRPVIGFRLVSDPEHHPHLTIGGPASLARSVVVAGIRARYSLPGLGRHQAFVVEVPADDDLDFALTPERARQVFDRGRREATRRLGELRDAYSSQAEA